MPRRARHLIPAGLPRRGELVAVCAVAILAAHLLFAQLTLVLALVFAATGKVSRWRMWWLLGPAAAGLAWTLAAGPGHALAGFAAGPSSILRYLSAGHLAGHLGHPLAAFGGARSWLPRQFPVALVCGSAEAALIGWLDWLHTDEWAVPPPRPGLVAALRRAAGASAIRAGTVVTRDGCALGVVSSTGAVADLRWTEASGGMLIAGAVASDVTLAGLQMVHAALRRRKPVIVLDPGDTTVARALNAACRATGTPLLTAGSPEAGGDAVRNGGTASVSAGDAVSVSAGGAVSVSGKGTVSVSGKGTVSAGARGAAAAGASGLWGRGTARVRQSDARAASAGAVIADAAVAGGRGTGAAVAGAEFAGAEPADGEFAGGEIDRAAIDLGRVVRGRLAVLLPAGSADLTASACTELGALARDLRRIGVDGDTLVWVPRGEQVPVQALAPLLREGPDAGLAVVIATTSPAAAAELGGLTGTALIFRVADADLAAGLAPRTGTRLLPRSLAAAQAGQRANTSLQAAPEPGHPVYPGSAYPGAAVPLGAPVPAVTASTAVASPLDLVPSPMIPARTLLTLGPGEFVLATGTPPQRLIERARIVPARLPHPPAHPVTDHSDIGYPETGHPDTAYPRTGYAGMGHPVTGHSDTGYPIAGRRDTGHSDTGYPGTGYAGTGRRDTGHQGTGRPGMSRRPGVGA